MQINPQKMNPKYPLNPMQIWHSSPAKVDMLGSPTKYDLSNHGLVWSSKRVSKTVNPRELVRENKAEMAPWSWSVLPWFLSVCPCSHAPASQLQSRWKKPSVTSSWILTSTKQIWLLAPAIQMHTLLFWPWKNKWEKWDELPQAHWVKTPSKESITIRVSDKLT